MQKRIFCLLWAIVLCFSLVSCGNSESENKSYNIKLTAKYEKDSKSVITTITNNTEKLAVYQDSAHYLYKKNNSKWEDITPDYADIGVSYHYVSPDKGENVFDFKYPVYDTTFDDSSKKIKEKGLEKGEYKISVKVYVCDPTEYYINKDAKGNESKVPDFNKNRQEMYIDALFSVN